MINTATFLGRLVTQPELKVTDNNKEYVRFTIAVSVYKDETLWLNCSAWGVTAQYISKMSKGNKIIVIGTLNPIYQNDEDGKKLQKGIMLNITSCANLEPRTATTETKETEYDGIY